MDGQCLNENSLMRWSVQFSDLKLKIAPRVENIPTIFRPLCCAAHRRATLIHAWTPRMNVALHLVIQSNHLD